MSFIKHITYLLSISILIGCSKYVGQNTTTSNNTNSNNTTVQTVAPSIKFYSVMDNGSMNVLFNGKQASSIANFYPSNYINGITGSNTISLRLPNGTTLLNGNIDLLNNTKYSCFFYKVGNEWKYSLIKDVMTMTLANGFAAARILDFRTQGYFDYINVRLVNPGFEIIDSKNRNFLDHHTYSSYTEFKQVGAGNYNIFMYNDTLTTSQRKNVNLDSRAFYSVVLTTPSNITPYQNAIFYIFPDAIKH
ncbi:MAG: hypothetical protein ACOVMM_03490 [Chitinophagaceae bacterium]